MSVSQHSAGYQTPGLGKFVVTGYGTSEGRKGVKKEKKQEERVGV